MTITREDIHRESFHKLNEKNVDDLLNLFSIEFSKYTVLVDAAVAWELSSAVTVNDAAINLRIAIKPFIKPLLSEKLDKLATERHGGKLGLVLRQLADEARELEK